MANVNNTNGNAIVTPSIENKNEAVNICKQVMQATTDGIKTDARELITSFNKDGKVMALVVSQMVKKTVRTTEKTGYFKQSVKIDKSNPESKESYTPQPNGLFKKEIVNGLTVYTPESKTIGEPTITNQPIVRGLFFRSTDDKHLGKVVSEGLTALKQMLSVNASYLKSGSPFHVHILFNGKVLSTSIVNPDGYKAKELLDSTKQNLLFGQIYRALNHVNKSEELAKVDDDIASALNLKKKESAK